MCNCKASRSLAPNGKNIICHHFSLYPAPHWTLYSIVLYHLWCSEYTLSLAIIYVANVTEKRKEEVYSSYNM